jgi:nucleoside-diphosphate-sugar epimerase
MRGAVVVGALTFVGYHLVQKLLAEGIEVLALDVDDLFRPSKVNEEKLLLIGRHAGFTYHSLQDREVWNEVREFDVVYFCLCEPNQYAQFPNQTMIHSYLERILGLCEKHGKRFVLLSSVNAATVRFYQEKGIETVWSENGTFFYKLEQITEQSAVNHAVLQVPTVYGPWQPAFMVYHQLILADIEQRETHIEVKENSEDVLYAADAAECLYEFGKKKQTGIHDIGSGIEGEWHKGVALLNGSNKIVIREKRLEKRAVPRYPFQPKLPLKEGIHQQVLHMKKYQKLYG